MPEDPRIKKLRRLAMRHGVLIRMSRHDKTWTVVTGDGRTIIKSDLTITQLEVWFTANAEKITAAQKRPALRGRYRLDDLTQMIIEARHAIAWAADYAESRVLTDHENDAAVNYLGGLVTDLQRLKARLYTHHVSIRGDIDAELAEMADGLTPGEES